MKIQCPLCKYANVCVNCKACHKCDKAFSSAEWLAVTEGTFDEITKLIQLLDAVQGWAGKWDKVTPRTQKATGMKLVCSSPWEGAGISFPKGLIQSQESLEEFLTITTDKFAPMFARPCPMSPRHGFVDSRVVNTPEDLRAVWDETIAADPDGELMLCSVYPEVLTNAVITPTSITVGAGNDGATAARAGGLVFPLVRKPQNSELKKLFKAARISAEDDPYFEVIWVPSGGTVTGLLTQMRAGPRIDTYSPNYLPAETIVSKVVIADLSISLLDWEKMMATAEPGTIVYHPTSLGTDHITVHCVTRKIPYFSTYCPAVGEVLVPSTTIPDYSASAFLDGFSQGSTVPLDRNGARQAVRVMLAGCHNSLAMTGESTRWVGVACALMLRLGSVAGRGEARHVQVEGKETHKPERSTVYSKQFNRNIHYHASGMQRLIDVFTYGNFGGGHMGGKKWAECCVALAPLFTACKIVAKEQSDQSVRDALSALNRAVNQAHWGGWWLNKFDSPKSFEIVQAPVWDSNAWDFYTMIGHFLYTIAQQPVDVELIARMEKWRDARPATAAIKAAEWLFDAISGTFSIKLSLTSRSGKMNKSVAIPSSKVAQVLSQQGLPDLKITSSELEGVNIVTATEGKSILTLANL